MSNALDTNVRERQQAALDNLTTTEHWTPEQVSLLKQTVARGATDDELRLFAAVCGRTKLDPFTGQIHFVKRWDNKLKIEVGAHQIGISGFRLISQRTGKDRGRLGPQWCGADGEWKDSWLDATRNPVAARVGLRHADYEEPVWEIARWDACVQTKKDGGANRFWDIRGPEMLAKCAEAAVRRAVFPQELGDLYAEEEAAGMDRLSEPEAVKPRAAAKAIAKSEKLRAEAEQSLAEVLDTEAGEGGMDAAPADTDGAPATDDASPLDAEGKREMLAQGGMDAVVTAVTALRHATKGQREFYGMTEGRVYIKDGELLTTIGSLKNGAPVNAWLDKIAANDAAWGKLCGAIIKVADELGVEVVS